MPSKLLIIIQVCLISFLLSHCGVLGEAYDPLNENKDHEEKYGEFAGDAIKKAERDRSSLMDLFGGSSPQFKDNIIWNVALDKISFMPLQSSDQMSGVITTEWYQVGDDLNNRIKLVVYVKSDAIEDASLDVKVFKEVFDGTKWNASKQSSDLAVKIKKSILDTAQELYIANEMS